MKLRRTIYIGAGGTGIDTIQKVKTYFQKHSSSGEVPPMIKFLAIDTNQPELQGRKLFPSEERLELSLPDAQQRFAQNKDEKWCKYFPSGNEEYLASLDKGAGQVRSNARFAILCKEMVPDRVRHSFKSKLEKIVEELTNIAPQASPDYELLPTVDIDVHIAFSLCGGTGSATFLTLAYLVREVLTQCTITGYAFGHNFFKSLPTRDRIDVNTYASLVELDYCMHASKPSYQNVVFPLQQKIAKEPFDQLMYIDKVTYTRGKNVAEHQFANIAQIEKSVAYAMVLAAGQIGTASASIGDNFKQDIANGIYNVVINGNEKKGWVCSLGVSEIFCNSDAEQVLFNPKLAIRILGGLKSSNSDADPASLAKVWLNDFKLNELGLAAEGDNDDVIEEIAKIDNFKNRPFEDFDASAPAASKTSFFSKDGLKESDAKRNMTILYEAKKNAIHKHLIEKLFPESEKTLGISYAINVLVSFAGLLGKCAVQMKKEIDEDHKPFLTSLNEEWAGLIKRRKELQQQRNIINRESIDEKIDNVDDSLRENAIKELEINAEIIRKGQALIFFNDLKSYIQDQLKPSLDDFKAQIDDTITKETNEISDLISTNSDNDNDNVCSINVSSSVDTLPENDPEKISYKFSDLLSEIQCGSIIDLGNCTNLKYYIDAFCAKKFGKTGKQIIRILDKLSDEELANIIQKAIKLSTPVMDIMSFGVTVSPVEQFYVAVPGGVIDERVATAIKNIYDANIQPTFIDLNDENRIIIYRQLGAVPPYFIKGVSEGMNKQYFNSSLEESFKKRKSAYVPFIDTQFQMIYDNGFSLSSVGIRDVEKVALECWVQSILLGIIQRTDNGMYRIQSDLIGQMDASIRPRKKWYNLDTDRTDAFNAFKNVYPRIKDEIGTLIAKYIQDEDKKAAFVRALANEGEFYDEYSLCPFESDEYKNNQDLMNKEFSYIVESQNRNV